MKNYFLGFLALMGVTVLHAQTCPPSGNTNLSTNPNTYYPGTQATVAVGSTTITLGTGSGPSGISIGDLVLIIQMQGAEINATNTNSYGDGTAGLPANGYLNNTNHRAGNMEFAIAASNVPVGGGTLTLAAGTVNAYQNSASSGTVGQYRYQVIRVPVYFNATLTASLSAPAWNGSTGGVLAIQARNNFSFGGFSLTANGAGFRGGGGRQLGGGSGASSDFRTAATVNNNGAKGEGTAGTPRFVNNNGTLLNTGVEGYPNGSNGQGAPGNAGGGSTDGNPGSNDQNSGGGGGGNGGNGGKGGNAWNSGLTTGGEAGAAFAQRAANRLVMGGGGGSATTNDGTGTPGSGFASSGAAGGGIVILYARTITGAGSISVNGANASSTVENDGSGGGGAGGSVLVFAGSGHNLITVTANGGNGGSNINSGGGSEHGPGGGGGGGVIISNGTLNAATTRTGGLAGTTTAGSNFGAAAGSTGILIQNATTPQYPNLSNNCLLLPVSLRSFTVQVRETDARLEWQSENEQDFRGYGVERSRDGIHYTPLGFVPGRGSAGLQTYQFTDAGALIPNGTVYYRLRLEDADGSFRYSPIRSLQSVSSGRIQIWPTTLPAGQPVTVRLSGNNTEWMQVRLLNSAGREIRRTSSGAGNLYTLSTDRLSAGMYWVEITGQDWKDVRKILIQ